MTQKYEVYKCAVCGNIVEVTHDGGGTLVCCGQPMTKMVAKSTEEGTEKHLPVVEKAEHGTMIKVGATPHPMEEKHYIEWIEVFLKDGKVVRMLLKPGDKPEMHIGHDIEDLLEVRAYCNIHGLWSKKLA
ncbi:MAG: desulfoferrodoxin [Candidatus Cryosericum sp.]